MCRAYVEHGMHKRRQPVKLWYLSSFFRYERAQAGRYRQFWQVGAEALGSDDPAVDAESIVLLAALLDELGVTEERLRLSSLGSAETTREYRERLKAHLRAHEERLSRGGPRSRIELNPLRAFDSDHPGTRAVMASAPRLLEHLDARTAEHFAEVRALLDAAGVAYEIDPTLVRGLDYYTRTVFELTSDALGAQSGVGGGGRYDAPRGAARRSADARDGLGGGDRADHAAGEPQPAASPRSSWTLRADEHEPMPPCRVWRSGEARSAGLGRADGAGRTALKGQLGHAALGRPLRGDRGAGRPLTDMEGGGQETEPSDTACPRGAAQPAHAL